MSNACRHLDAYSIASLGIYVYGLIDPETNHVIYVGKGGGKFEERAGNLRVFAHFSETERAIQQVQADPSYRPSRKCEAIRAVWERAQDVRIHFYRRRLRDEAEAFHVEAAIIAALSNSTHRAPLNDSKGMLLNEHGDLSLQGVIDRAAPLVNPAAPYRALLFNIKNSLPLQQHTSAADIYECTRSAWVLSEKPTAHNDVVAIGFSDFISRGAYTQLLWSSEAKRRRSFTSIRQHWLPNDHELVGRSFKRVLSCAPAFKYGKVIGVQFDGLGRFQFFLAGPRNMPHDFQYNCLE